MTSILPALCVGASVGALTLFLSHIAPFVGAGNFIRDIDQPRLFGRTITRREGHLVGVCIHIVLSAVFGGVFGLLVDLGVAPGFGIVPLLAWGVLLALVTGVVILPLEGHGFFGVKEDAWFPVDLLLTNALWALFMWIIMGIWQGLVR